MKSDPLIHKRRSMRLQRYDYYDHIIRNEEEYERIYAYIESNPLNWKEDEENPAR